MGYTKSELLAAFKKLYTTRHQNEKTALLGTKLNTSELEVNFITSNFKVDDMDDSEVYFQGPISGDTGEKCI